MDNDKYSYKLGVEGYSDGTTPDTAIVPIKPWWVYATISDKLRVAFSVNWRALYYADTIAGKVRDEE